MSLTTQLSALSQLVGQHCEGQYDREERERVQNTRAHLERRVRHVTSESANTETPHNTAMFTTYSKYTVE